MHPELTQLHGVPTTWMLKNLHGHTTLPQARIGSLTLPVLDCVCYEDSLVWLAVVGASSGFQAGNTQEVKHLAAILAGSDKANKGRKRPLYVGEVYGDVHPHFTGQHAPDSPEWQAYTQERAGFIARLQDGNRMGFRFNLRAGWTYKHDDQFHQEANAIEYIYYADCFDDPFGFWLVPIMTSQRERERLFHREVLQRCTTLQCAEEWAGWLYQWCQQSHFDPVTNMTIQPMKTIRAGGRFAAFKLTLAESMIRAAISEALRAGELPPLKGSV